MEVIVQLHAMATLTMGEKNPCQPLGTKLGGSQICFGLFEEAKNLSTSLRP